MHPLAPHVPARHSFRAQSKLKTLWDKKLPFAHVYVSFSLMTIVSCLFTVSNGSFSRYLLSLRKFQFPVRFFKQTIFDFFCTLDLQNNSVYVLITRAKNLNFGFPLEYYPSAPASNFLIENSFLCLFWRLTLCKSTKLVKKILFPKLFYLQFSR